MKDVCATHGTLPDESIMISNGTPVCGICGQPLYAQTELDSGNPPQYELDEAGSWRKVE